MLSSAKTGPADSLIIFFVKPNAGRRFTALYIHVTRCEALIGDREIRRLKWLTNYQFSMFFWKIPKRFCAANKPMNPSPTPHSRVERWGLNGL
jgi:hypothetical protein